MFRYLKHCNNDVYKYNGWELFISIGDVYISQIINVQLARSRMISWTSGPCVSYNWKLTGNVNSLSNNWMFELLSKFNEQGS